MSKLTIIGDVHGKFVSYDHIARKHDKTLQLGDMGFNYDCLRHYIDPTKDKMFFGNHDNYDQFTLPNNIGHFGMYGHGVDFYYVRGGYSVDLHYRVLRVSWWPEEELPQIIWDKIIDDYAKAKPEIMITHECPRSIIDKVAKYPDSVIEQRFGCRLPSQTSVLLQYLLEEHAPKLWVFGHYHVDRKFKIPNHRTKFVCLKELGTYDIL